MKFVILLALLGAAAALRHHQQHQGKYDLENRNIQESVFRHGREYQYIYNGQLSTGIPTPSTPQGITRLQTLVTIQMEKDHTMRMRLNNFQFATSQQQKNLRSLQPMERFEEFNMELEQQQMLEMPFEFTYKHGVVSDIRFGQNDQPWSENIKRAVVNMFQLNLLKAGRIEKTEKAESNDNAFTVVEKSLEGECQTFYTIEENVNEEKNQQRWTKSVNFEKCNQRPLFHQVQSQVCKDCQQTMDKDQMSSTVLSFNITRDEKEFLINSVELRSQQMFTPISERHQLLTAFTVNTLELVYAGEQQSKKIESVRSSNVQSLIYNPKVELAEQQWSQTGEEKYLRQLPQLSENKVEIVNKLFTLVSKQLEDGEVELETSHNVARIVKILRLCNEQELETIYNQINEYSNEKMANEMRSIYLNTLTLSATRTTIQQFIQIVKESKNVSPIRVSFSIKSLVDMKYPSVQIAEDVQELCQSTTNPLVQQSCWLTYGSIVNGACSPRNEQWLETTCPREVKQKIVDQFVRQFERSTSRNDQILVLKTIANAGLDLSIYPLQKIMNNDKYETTIRVQAIEALRRLRQLMPVKIQQVLLPIYKNRQQPQHLRMTALYHLLSTQPQWSVLSQIGQQLRSEKNQQVRSFTLSLLQSFARSESVCEKTFSDRVETLLQTVPFNSQDIERFESRYGKWTQYWQREQSGFDANVASLFTNESILPTEMMTSIDGVFSGEWNQYIAQIGFTQKNIEKTLKQFVSKIQQNGFEDVIVRGKRSTKLDFQPTQFWNNLMEKIGFSKKQVNSQEPHVLVYIRHRDMDYAFLPIDAQSIPEVVRSMINGGRIEIGDIERVLAQGIHFSQSSASFIYETSYKMISPIGMPVQMTSKMPTVARINGQIKMELEPKKSENMDGVRVHFKIQPQIASTHVLSLSVVSPFLQAGTKFLHQIVYNTPVDMEVEMKWQDKFVLRTIFHNPTEESRWLMIQSRPVTFVKTINRSGHQYPEPIEMTWMQPAHQLMSQQINRQYDSLKIQGTWNTPLNRQIPSWIVDNTIEFFYSPTTETPKKYEAVVEIDLYSTAKMEKGMNKYFKKSGNSEKYLERDEEYDETEQRQEIEKKFEWLENEKVYKHLMNVEVKPEILNFNVEAVCNADFHFCKTEIKSEELKATIQHVYPMVPKNLEQMKQQKYRNLLIVGDATWKSNNVDFKLQGEQSVEQKEWIKKIEGDEQDVLFEASRLDQYQLVMEYDWETKSNTVQRFWNLVQSYIRVQYPFTSEVEQNQGTKNMIRAKLNIEPRQRQMINFTVETPEERFNVPRVQLPFALPTAQIHHHPTSQRSQNQRFVEKMIHHSAKQADCVVKSSKIQTFDRVFFTNKFTPCYSVLASDCSSESKTPRFFVLMKTDEKETGRNTMKIFYRGEEIEVEKKENQMELTINDKQQTEQNEIVKKNYNIMWLNENTIKFESDEISVQFDGINARIHLSAFYQQQQCGLCGHYDNEKENDFLAADQQKKTVPEFVRSFIYENEECNVDKKMFEDDKTFRQIEEEQDDEEMNGQWDQQEYKDEEKNVQQPKQQIVAIERQRETCFTQKSVARCEEAENVVERTNQKVDVYCLPSSDSFARRLIRDIRRQPFSQWPQQKLEQLRNSQRFMEREMRIKVDERCF